jgi:hypothetical protein
VFQTRQLSGDDFLFLLQSLDASFPITLVLGAGISSHLIPTWNELIHELLESSIESILGFSNCQYTDKDAFAIENRNQRYWKCRAFEVTYVR